MLLDIKLADNYRNSLTDSASIPPLDRTLTQRSTLPSTQASTRQELAWTPSTSSSPDTTKASSTFASALDPHPAQLHPPDRDPLDSTDPTPEPRWKETILYSITKIHDLTNHNPEPVESTCPPKDVMQNAKLDGHWPTQHRHSIQQRCYSSVNLFSPKTIPVLSHLHLTLGLE